MANVNDAKESAKEAFSRFRTRVEPRLATLQDRIAPHLPDKVNQQIAQIPLRRTPSSASTTGAVHAVPLPPSSKSSSTHSLPLSRKSVGEEGERRSVEIEPAVRAPESAAKMEIVRKMETAKEREVKPEMRQEEAGDAGDDGRRDKDDRAPLLPLRPITRATALSWSTSLHSLASRILYRSGICPISAGPLLVLNAAAFPDATEIDYNKLLPYVLANLPSDEELEGADGYSVVMFAGGGSSAVGSGGTVAGRPSWAWTLQAYHLLGRAVRKKIRRLWVVHEKAWVRVLFEMMTGVVSGKFRKKVVHVATLSELAKQLPIQHLLIPPSAYLHNRKLEPSIILPNFPPAPVFGRPPFPTPRYGDPTPLPDILTDATAYLRTPECLATEGIFRIPASQIYLEILREAYDRQQAVRWDDWGAHSAAGLIKLYYRSLPTPVIPEEFYDQLPTGESEEKDKALVQKLLKDALPLDSRVLLMRHLIPLLALIAEYQHENKMNARNLAVCVAGSLARSDDVMKDVAAGDGVRRLVETAVLWLEKPKTKFPAKKEPAEKGGMGKTGMPVGRKPVPAPVETGIGADAVRRPQDSPRRKPVPSPPLDPLTKVETNPERKPQGFGEQQARRPSLPISPSPTVIISPSHAPSTFSGASTITVPKPTAHPVTRRPSLVPPADLPQLRRKQSVPALPTIPALAVDPANPGTFKRPQLRRVVSANLDVKKREDQAGGFRGADALRPVGLRRGSAASGAGLDSLPESGADGAEAGADAAAGGAGGRGLRRVRSAGVRELSLLYEERARSAKVLESLKRG